MVTARAKLLLGALVAACAIAAGTGTVPAQVPCIPGAPAPLGCPEPRPLDRSH